MTRQILFFLCLLMMFCSGNNVAAEPVPANVRELIIIGLEYNFDLQVERLNIPLAEAEVVVNDALFDAELFAATSISETSTPLSSSLSLINKSEITLTSGQVGLRKLYDFGLQSSLSLTTEWTDDNSQTDDLDPRFRSSLSLSLVQPLLRNFGKDINTTSLLVSRNRQNQSELQHLLQAQNLALQIELLACQVAGGSRIVDLRAESVALAEELYKANQRRFDIGVIPVSEVQEAETALANRQLARSQAVQSKDLSLNALNRQLNFSLSSDFAATQLYPLDKQPSDYVLPDRPELFESAREKSPSILLAELDIDNAALQRHFFRNQLKPQLDLQFQAGLNGLSGDERSAIGSRYAGSWPDSFSSAAAADGYQWSIGLEFSLPLGNRSATAKLRQSKLQEKQAHYQQRDLEAELDRALEQQSINLKRAFEQVKIAERFERLARLSLQQEQRRLEEGLSDTFRIINFQDNMIDAKIGRINALVQYFSSVAEMNYVRGIILEQHNITLAPAIEEKTLENI